MPRPAAAADGSLDTGMSHGLDPPEFSDRKPFPKMAKRKTSSFVENAKTVAYAGLIAIGIRTFAFEPFNIPSGSMEPTLLVGDYVFVSKFSYGYSRFSLPFSPALFSGRIFRQMPARGDVAVFRLPRDTSIDYIKRVIGLPGDRIQVRDGLLYVNGEQVARSEAGHFDEADNGITTRDRRYLETLPEGVKHFILKQTSEGFQNNTQEYLVPPDRVFMMGDNRDNSQDSRFMDAVGFVPVENLIGKAEIIFFSVDATAPWWEIWQWPFEIRWSRLLTMIH